MNKPAPSLVSEGPPRRSVPRCYPACLPACLPGHVNNDDLAAVALAPSLLPRPPAPLPPSPLFPSLGSKINPAKSATLLPSRGRICIIYHGGGHVGRLVGRYDDRAILVGIRRRLKVALNGIIRIGDLVPKSLSSPCIISWWVPRASEGGRERALQPRY